MDMLTYVESRWGKQGSNTERRGEAVHARTENFIAITQWNMRVLV